MPNRVIIAGVGMTNFYKPSAGKSYQELGIEAVQAAISDAGIPYQKIQQAYTGWVYGDSASGQSVLYNLVLSGIPIINVNNNCSSGSTALFLARQAVEYGAADCVLALGFEQMNPGALKSVYDDRPDPLKKFIEQAQKKFNDSEGIPVSLLLFAAAGFEYQQKYGTKNETFAKVRQKSAMHARHNPKAVLREPLTIEQILDSPLMFLNLTRLQCSFPTSGAAAVVVCSEKFARSNGLKSNIVIKGQALITDTDSSFENDSMMNLVGYDMSRRAADSVYQQSGAGAEDIGVVELHDCFTTNEVITYEALGLCEVGQAEKFIWDGDNTYGGKVVTNPSGGLLAKGHPLGATGLAQCCELVWQLRGTAGERQVKNPGLALQHNIGLGGACVVTMYEKIK